MSKALLGRVVEPQPLARLERELSVGDAAVAYGRLSFVAMLVDGLATDDPTFAVADR